MTENPYASPTAESHAVPDAAWESRPLRVASQGKRFLNLILDSIVIHVLSMAAGFVVGVIIVASRMSAGRPVTTGDEAGLQVAGFVVGLMVCLGYFVIMEGLFQRTLAKLLTGTIVVTETGARPSFGQILGRSFARLIPFEAFSFLGTDPVGWHDSLSGTRVVNTR